MKRFHVHVAVDDLDASIRFYSAMFGASPSVTKPDYAKWMIDEPSINFAISDRGTKKGLDHLGLQVDSDEELGELRRKVTEAQIVAFDQGQTECCYARSDKYWTTDPQGIAWETYHTVGEVEVYGADMLKAAGPSACCAPQVKPGAASVASQLTSCC